MAAPRQLPPGIVPYINSPQQLVVNNQPELLVPPVEGKVLGGYDLRSAMDTVLANNGQAILLQKMNMKIHCQHCWNELEGEGDPSCIYCLGRGYLSVLERHLARRQITIQGREYQFLQQGQPGPQRSDTPTWFFAYNANPQQEDIIYEVTWADAQKLLPQKLIAAYRVEFADPFRGAGGRIEYWKTACEVRPLQRDTEGSYIRRLAPQTATIPPDGIIRYGAIYHQPHTQG